MKIRVGRASLQAALAVAGQAVASRTTRPILSNVRFAAAGDSLTLAATDLEIGIAHTLPGVAVEREGAAMLPAGRLASILSVSDGEEVAIDAAGETASVRVGSGRFKLNTFDPAEFPDPAAFDETDVHTVSAATVRSLSRRVTYAADRKESAARWATTGVLWEAHEAAVKLVATDTKRLAVCEGDRLTPGVVTPGCLIPSRAIAMLDKCMGDDANEVAVSLTANQAQFRVNGTVLTTKLIEGRFPPYRDIVPKKFGVRLTVTVGELLKGVRQAMAVVDDATRRVDCEFGAGVLRLSARGAEIGTGEVEVPLPGYAGEAVCIAFDPVYLVDFLRAVDGGDDVTVEMTDGEKPAVFRVGAAMCLIMPLAG